MIKPGEHGSDYSDFGVLASAVAGRSVQVGVATQSRAWSDGSAIWLPAGLSRRDAALTVTAQAGLLHAGSHYTPELRRLSGARLEQYVLREVLRAVHELGDVLPPGLLVRFDQIPPNGPTPDWLGTIRPRAVNAPPSTTGSAAQAGDETASSDLPELTDEDEATSQSSKILEKLSAPALQNPLATALQKMLGAGRAASDRSGGDELPVRGHRAGQVGANGKRITAPAFLKNLLGSPPPIGTRYPEWDCHRHAYRPDWCAVSQLDPATAPDASAKPYTDPALRRELLRLGLRRERHRRRLDGDDLDLSAVIDFQLDRAIGRTPDPRVFETRLHTARDLGVIVLLDTTGSSAETADVGTTFEQHRELAGRLTQTLSEIGDRVATYGFYSRGRGSVRLLRVANFDDRFDQGAALRLASLKSAGFTRLGAVIRHAADQVQTRAGTTNQLLIVISDAFAYDDGYEDRYARHDTRRALREAHERGIGCVGLRVGRAADDDAFEAVWRGLPHRELHDPDDLARHVRRLFNAALAHTTSSTPAIGMEAS